MQYLQMALPVIEVVFALLITWLVAVVIRKFKLKELEAESIKALGAGITTTFRTVVKPWKQGQDGKLTEFQKDQARSIAKGAAEQLLKGPALRFFKAMWNSRKDQIIESLVSKFKKDGKGG